ISAVSNSVTPRSIALWITLREVSRSVRWPKLLQPRPTAETRRPEPPRLRICMENPVGGREVRAALWRALPASARCDRTGVGMPELRPARSWAQKDAAPSDAAFDALAVILLKSV